MTAFGVRPEASVKDLTRDAVTEALSDAGAELGDVEAAYFGNTCQGVLEGQIVVAGQIALRSMGFERIPMVNVENACATGATALHQAVMHVRSGAADVVLAVGVEKLNIGDKQKSLDVFDGGVDVNDPEGLWAILRELGGGVPDAQRSHSLFMDIYAALAPAHMDAVGPTQPPPPTPPSVLNNHRRAGGRPHEAAPPPPPPPPPACPKKKTPPPAVDNPLA